ncbi:MAG: hypothetical protein IJC52_00225 [Clostridia bacterium]|nr:hypothetical protein [Clostridia bacterium]
MMKRIVTLLTCVAMLLALSVCVCAEPTAEEGATTTTTAPAASGAPVATDDSMSTFSKIYSLMMTETEGRINTTPATPAFWEYPILRAGETLIGEGTMIVKNDSEFTVDMQMEPLLLPYGNTAKLAYLDCLWLTVREGETVLYDNTYAHINDEDGGLSLNYVAMPPGEEHTYTITMRCAYDYNGDPYADVAPLAWSFKAKTETTVYEEPQGLPAWAQILVISFAVMMVILIIIMIVQGILNASRKRKAKKALLAQQAADEPEETETEDEE